MRRSAEFPHYGQTGSWPLRIADRYWETPFTTLILDQMTRNGVRVALPTSHYRTRPESWHSRLPDTCHDRFQLHCERPKLCGCIRTLHRDSIVTAVMEGGKRAFELALTGTDSRKVMIATVDGGRLLQSVGFFTTCSGGLLLSFCCFFLPSSFVLDFLQSEIVLEGIHPCNVHELPNGKFGLGNLSRLL